MNTSGHSRGQAGAVAACAWPALVLALASGGCALNFGLPPVDGPDVDTSEDTQADHVDTDTRDDGPDVPDVDDLDGADLDATDPDGFDTENPDLGDVDSMDPPADDTAVEDVPAEEMPDPYDPIVHYTMDLRASIEAIPISSDPLTLQVPDSTRRNRWRWFLDDLLAGNYSGAYSRSVSYDINVFAITDTGTIPNRDYLVAYNDTRGEGIYAFNVAPAHPLAVEVPYPVDDVGTLSEGIEMLRQVDGWALLVAGTTRCSRTDSIICDGTTVACTGTASSFRTSDVAHNPNLMFQNIHTYLPTKDATSIFVQIQGQADSSGAYAIVSDGTTIHSLSGISVELRNGLRFYLPSYSSEILSCNDSGDASGYVSTCGITNAQGRASNGSASPCNTAAVSSSNRFVVLELSTEMRQESTFAAIADAVGALF